MPLDRPPFVAYHAIAGLTFSFGGVRIDPDGRALGVDGTPVPGLYAAGEATGGLFYGDYPGGAALMRAAVFGRTVGRTAATEAMSVREPSCRATRKWPCRSQVCRDDCCPEGSNCWRNVSSEPKAIVVDSRPMTSSVTTVALETAARAVLVMLSDERAAVEGGEWYQAVQEAGRPDPQGDRPRLLHGGRRPPGPAGGAGGAPLSVAPGAVRGWCQRPGFRGEGLGPACPRAWQL